MRLALLLRELEQVQRALDVHVMRGHRRELGPRREQRREMKDAVDLELGEHPIEERAVSDRSDELAADQRRELGVERIEVGQSNGPGSRPGR